MINVCVVLSLLSQAVEPHVEVVGEEQGAGRDIKQ